MKSDRRNTKFVVFLLNPPLPCVHAVCVLMKKKYNKKKEKRVIRVRQMDIAVVHMSNIFICEMILRKCVAQENVTKLSPRTFPFHGTGSN